MITLVLVLVAALFAALVAVYVLATRGIVKSIGLPTPEEARITNETDDLIAKIEVQNQKDKSEVANADKPALLKSLRVLVSRGVRKP